MQCSPEKVRWVKQQVRLKKKRLPSSLVLNLTKLSITELRPPLTSSRNMTPAGCNNVVGAYRAMLSEENEMEQAASEIESPKITPS